MKYLEWLMFAIQVTVMAILLWALFGCANTQMVEDIKSESEYRKSLREQSWMNAHEFPPDLEWETYEAQECEYDDSIDIGLKDFLPNNDWEKIELEEDELPQYTVIELADGRKKYLWKGDGKAPGEVKPKVLGFTVPEADPEDCIGEVCRGDSVPYLSNLAGTGNIDGVPKESFQEWYDKEVAKRKKLKYKLSQIDKDTGASKWRCKTVTRQRLKSQPLAMPKEWMDQWPSLRDQDVDKNSEK